MDNYDDIKVVGIDVDGTLTDGKYLVGSLPHTPHTEVDVLKSFYTRDFYAIEELMKAEICVVIISQAHDSCINRQIRRIRSHSTFWETCFRKDLLTVLRAINNKEIALEEYFLQQKESWGRSLWWNNLAYIGDAQGDMVCLKQALYSGIPSDAVVGLLDADFISGHRGGEGAVYEFCMDIINGRIK